MKSILYILLYFGLPTLLHSQHSLPFDLEAERIVFQVRLNQVPHKFALDFKHNSVLDQELVEMLKLPIINTSWYKLWKEDSVISNDVLIENFSMAAWTFRDKIFTAIDFNSLEEDLELSGFIGLDFFKNFVVEINFLKKLIILHPKDYLPTISAFKVKLDFYNQIPYASVSVNQQLVPMILDFSAERPLMLSKENPLGSMQQLVANSTEWNDSNLQRKHINVQSFQLEDIVLKDVSAWLYEKEAAYLSNAQLAGGMGTGIFKDRIIYMDFNKKSLWINQ